MEDEATKFCQNCKHDIPACNYEIHIIHCQRRIQLCPLCDEAVPRSELEAHTTEFHSAKKCMDCGDEIPSSEVDAHKKEICKKRIVSCQHCELELKEEDIAEHENYCGSRTEMCECGKLIMLKYQQLHLDSYHRRTRPQNEECDDTESDEDEEDYFVGANSRDNDSYLPRRKGKRNSVPKFPGTNNAGRNSVGAKFRERANKNAFSYAAAHAEDNNLNATFENAAYLDNFSDAMNNEIHKILNEAPPSTIAHNHTWMQEVYLPCEFCNKSVVADDLVRHQSGCHPALFTNESHSEYAQRENSDSEDEANHVFIPCEFCLKHFSAAEIVTHQSLCQTLS